MELLEPKEEPVVVVALGEPNEEPVGVFLILELVVVVVLIGELE